MEVREPVWIGDDCRSIDLPSREIEIVDKADVLVVGGGTAGVPAAIAAGRREADVVLVESNPFLGGTATAGKVHVYYYGVGGGLQAEIERKTLKLQERFEIKSFGLHPECKKLVLQEMARQAKVRTYLKTLAVGVIMEGNTVRGVIVENISGRKAIMAEVIVDATGDGDIAAMAGAEFRVGRETDGFTQPYSLPPVKLEEKGLRYVNFDAGWLDPSDIRDISKALLEARSHLWKDEGYRESDRYIEIATMLGVRESRWVIGDYVLTLMDQIENRRFPDVIARCWANYDNHAVDYENESELAQIWVSILGLWGKEIGCDVPYRSLLPKGIENLIVACRAISADHDAQMALRMQKTMEVIGEAAGIAAALSAKQGIPPRQLDPKKIQAILVQSGVLEPTVLDKAHYMEQPVSPKPGLNELIGKLAEEDNSETIWQITRYGGEAVPRLLELLSSDDKELRFSAAIALGILRRVEAAPELRRALTEEHRELSDPRAVPRRIAAAILLGMIGYSEAAPDLANILREPDIDPHSATFLIKALGKMGDPSCVDPIREYVQSELPDMPVKLSGGAVESSMRWSVDIAAGQVLMKFGDPMGEEIVRRYLDDPRSPVRRYAHKVLGGKG
ncbi:FAD-dependent oxidoreductase [Candidatus Poribacteria bacterium]|nr:FAD-dependent oxidoreductase [Candidatus Poribacteria bacterium]